MSSVVPHLPRQLICILTPLIVTAQALKAHTLLLNPNDHHSTTPFLFRHCVLNRLFISRKKRLYRPSGSVTAETSNPSNPYRYLADTLFPMLLQCTFDSRPAMLAQLASAALKQSSGHCDKALLLAAA
jgi:hypothetical protein